MGGFFAIARSRLLELAPKTSGFKIVFEAIVRGSGTLRVREIPIAFRERLHGKSKMSFGVALRFFLRWLHMAFRHLIDELQIGDAGLVAGLGAVDRRLDLGRAHCRIGV